MADLGATAQEKKKSLLGGSVWGIYREIARYTLPFYLRPFILSTVCNNIAIRHVKFDQIIRTHSKDFTQENK